MPDLLKLDGELLATFTATELDGNWWYGTVTTTEAFHKVEPLIRQASDIEGDFDLFGKLWDEIYKMGVVLETTSGEVLDPIQRPFVLMVYDDGTASLRY